MNAVLPAEGHLFLTMYRVIFLGTPCNHGSQNKVAIKSVSLHSLFKVKESTSCTILCEGRSISIPKVVQLRTLTSQVRMFCIVCKHFLIIVCGIYNMGWQVVLFV